MCSGLRQPVLSAWWLPGCCLEKSLLCAQLLKLATPALLRRCPRGMPMPPAVVAVALPFSMLANLSHLPHPIHPLPTSRPWLQV